MAKDAKGHGSDARGGGDSTTRTQSGRQMFGRKPSPGVQKQLGQMTQAFSAFAGEMHKSGDPAAAHQAAVKAAGVSDTQAAGALAQGGPKSGAVPVHSGATGRNFPITVIGDPGHAAAQKATIARLTKKRS